jgi:hypothetical protein
MGRVESTKGCTFPPNVNITEHLRYTLTFTITAAFYHSMLLRGSTRDSDINHRGIYTTKPWDSGDIVCERFASFCTTAGRICFNPLLSLLSLRTSDHLD